MILLQKKCELILSECKEAILSSPSNTDFEPYISALSEDEFGDGYCGMVRLRKERVISTLFLNLYGLYGLDSPDASALKRDLCKLVGDRLDSSVDKTPSLRRDLFQRLYDTLLLYAGGNLSPLIQACQEDAPRAQGVSRDDPQFKEVFLGFESAVRSDPNITWFAPYIQKLILLLRTRTDPSDWGRNCEESVLVHLLRSLYGTDCASLLEDQKTIMTAKAKSAIFRQPEKVCSQREDLFLLLCDVFSLKDKDDLSFLFEMCDRIQKCRGGN